MASSALAFDLTTAYLDQPSFIAYGLVRGAGNLVLQQQLSDNSTLAFYVLGDGPWDSLLRLWINRKLIALPSTQAHFHPGIDGEIGSGMAASSTGADQHVDAFWANVPGLSTLTYSRYAWLALNVPPDPGAPSASLEVLADYQAMKCRIFDAAGNQTAFQWTQNPAWWICDRIIRRFVLREAKVNQPLVAAELARFDWQSFSDAALYYDADIGGGIKRFSDGGVVFLDGSLTEDRVLEQLLLVCRSYLLERNGKICLYADKPRASVLTFTSDNVAPQTFVVKKSHLRGGKNRIRASFRELNRASGSVDDATRFSISTQKLDHEAHQRAIGVRGPGLSVIPKALELQLDFGNNTAERISRLIQHQLVRQLGDDVDANATYNAPFQAEWVGFEDSLAIEPGDVATIDKSISEEFGSTDYEVLEVEERPDGSRAFRALQYVVSAFPDTAPTQQGIEAPTPGTGLTLPNGIEMVRNPTLEYGDSGWTKGTGFSIASDPANAYAGSWVAQFVGAAAAAFRNVVLIAVQPGDTLLASCMAKRTAGDGSARVRIDWLSAALAELSQSAGNSVIAAAYAISRVVGIAPASAAFARVEAEVFGMTVSTTAYFDQFYASMFPKNLGDVADDATTDRRAATANQKIGGDRGFAAIDAGNIVVAGSVDLARAYINKGALATKNSVDLATGDVLNKNLGNVADDVGSGRRAVVKGQSTALNEQGNIPASALAAGWLASNTNSLGNSQWAALTAYAVGDIVRQSALGGSPGHVCITAGTSGAAAPSWAATNWGTTNDGTVVWRKLPANSGSLLKFTWNAFTLYKADQTTVAIPASTTESIPSAPALSQVAGGTLPARTRYVRVALCKNGMMYGISAESSLAVSVNNLLKVTSPASVSGYDGWLPLVGPAVNEEQMISDGTITVDAPIAFATDYTEPVGGVETALAATSARWSSDNNASANHGIRRWSLAASTTYYWYPAWNVALSLLFLANAGVKTAADPASAGIQSGDGNIGLSAGSVQITQPAAGSTGSGSSGGGGGGRGTA